MINPTGVDETMIVRSETPFNAEPPLARLGAAFITPQPLFYVRSHGNIPVLDAANHRLKITGLVGRPMELGVDDLRARFEHRVLTATMQCAGNRRADMNEVKKVDGDLWHPGAIGNADWGGVRLADVLRAAGVDEGADLHVAFAACDEVEMEGERFRFGVSIPLAKALSPDVLLAFEMNGGDLAPAHGYPLRAVVPGYAGVRSPKWLAGIEVRQTPSENHVQQKDYKLMPPHMSKETVDWHAGFVINEMPLNSAICQPEDGAKLPAGPNFISGYAMASGRAVVRVDVSVDAGRTWQQAALQPQADTPWSWVLWRTQIELPKGKTELLVRAWDAAGQTQPSDLKDTWNFKGYLSAAWHRITVHAS